MSLAEVTLLGKICLFYLCLQTWKNLCVSESFSLE